MTLSKFKITAVKCPGYMMVVYQDNVFKSVLNEFNPPLSERQLNVILNCIPTEGDKIAAIFKAAYPGKLLVEPVKAIGEEPAPQSEAAHDPDFGTNQKIALWCRLYAEHHKDGEGRPVKYKTGAAEAGKMKGLADLPGELEKLLAVYFKADDWYLKPKSISNFIKKFNEVRALAYAKPAPKSYPLPYNHVFFCGLPLMEKRAYQDYLKAAGYVFQHNPVRGGTWVKA